MADSGAKILDNVRKLLPLIRETARDSELARQPNDSVMEAARNCGLFSLLVPKRYGGLEADLDLLLEVGLLLGEADASTAWVLDFYIVHNWMFCQFPESFQKVLFANNNYVLAPGMFSPSGKAVTVDGGYRLKGRWQWGTGIVHADWVLAGALQDTEQGPAMFWYALPRSDVEMVDTWQMSGMCATGSHDVAIHDKIVPPDRRVSSAEMRDGRAPGSTLHYNPLYSIPAMPLLSLGAALPCIGQAKAAVKEFSEQIRARYDFASLNKQVDRQSRQIRIAHAALQAECAELLVRQVVREMIELRSTAVPATRARWGAQIAHAVHQARGAISEICEAAGASSQFLSNPLQRSLRDANTMSCHTVFDVELRYRSMGRALFGLDPDGIY